MWLGKNAADHDVLAIGDHKLVRCKSVRHANKIWDSGRLMSLAIGPGDLLKSPFQIEDPPAFAPLPYEASQDTASASDAAQKAADAVGSPSRVSREEVPPEVEADSAEVAVELDVELEDERQR